MAKYKQLKEITLNDVLEIEDIAVRDVCMALLLQCGFIEKEGKQYHWGQRFLYGERGTGLKYILASVNYKQVSLIQYEGKERCGGRWTEPISVEDANAITEEEFDLITGKTSTRYFTLIEE